MKDLDPKSLIIGFLAASVVGLVVALIQPKEETKESEAGTYVPMQQGYILDTRNGTQYAPALPEGGYNALMEGTGKSYWRQSVSSVEDGGDSK